MAKVSLQPEELGQDQFIGAGSAFSFPGGDLQPKNMVEPSRATGALNLSTEGGNKSSCMGPLRCDRGGDCGMSPMDARIAVTRRGSVTFWMNLIR